MFGSIGKALLGAVRRAVLEPTTDRVDAQVAERLKPTKDAVMGRCVQQADAAFDHVEDFLDDYAAVGAAEDRRSVELAENVRLAMSELGPQKKGI